MVIASYRLFLLTFAVTICFSSFFLAAENNNSALDKLVDQIDDIVGGGLDPETFETKCYFDPNECNLKQLCEIATTGEDGSKSWNADAEAYVELAKEYGLSCGVGPEKAETAESCSSETAYQCSEKELCSWASSGGEWKLAAPLQIYVEEAKKRGLTCGVKRETAQDYGNWSDASICRNATTKQGKWTKLKTFQPFVNEAKKRGLGCGTIKDKKMNFGRWADATICAYATLNSQWKTASDFKAHVSEAKRRGLSCGTEEVDGPTRSPRFANWDEDILCKYAFKNGSWTNIEVYQPHVLEAKRRGLSCGVDKKVTDKNTDAHNCYAEPSICDDKRLCGWATRPGKRSEWSIYNKRHIAEAKRRGLSCGISAKTVSKVPKITLESYFKAQSVTKRKQIQYALSSRSYYKKAIDGKWGAGTKKAVNEFLFFHKNLEDQQVASVYDAILDLVDTMPTSFDNVKKKSASSNTKSSSNKTTTNKKSDKDAAAEAAAVCALELGAAIATGGLSLLFNDGCLF